MYILPSVYDGQTLPLVFTQFSRLSPLLSAEPWHLDFAAKAIGFAVLFDGLDGCIARMTRTDSTLAKNWIHWQMW